MRKAPFIAVLAAALTGCGLVPAPFAQPAAPPRTASPTPSGTTPTPAPTPAPSPSASSESIRLTVSDAKKAAASWVAEHNRTVRDRDWWDDASKRDELFWEGTRHEVVIDQGHVKDGDKDKFRKPIRLTGRQTYYVPRRQPPGGEWFLLQATYRGQDRPHIMAFWRPEGESFKLAAKTPLHYGRRVPAPRLDSEGYVTAASRVDGTAIALEYMTFWNGSTHKRAGALGYRLAKDNYSRLAYPKVVKGLYGTFRSFTPAYGFRTRDGGSFYVFSLLNNPQSVVQVLTVGGSLPPGGKTIQEIAGDWYA
ncbi:MULTISPECIES: hypothetical protein [Streptosporangium]|uniref:DUF8094 domain-containing protein n=1 Tax=Streptosporangium brasiliense TaxID=47480 RepID=A0ABT9QZM5_9ACTN|nr:hypothetical protein [Streptosporangium brasiliense]MDP9862116.1 hypothetical protein [Streptosporangium brasiliense]